MIEKFKPVVVGLSLLNACGEPERPYPNPDAPRECTQFVESYLDTHPLENPFEGDNTADFNRAYPGLESPVDSYPEDVRDALSFPLFLVCLSARDQYQAVLSDENLGVADDAVSFSLTGIDREPFFLSIVQEALLDMPFEVSQWVSSYNTPDSSASVNYESPIDYPVENVHTYHSLKDRDQAIGQSIRDIQDDFPLQMAQRFNLNCHSVDLNFTSSMDGYCDLTSAASDAMAEMVDRHALDPCFNNREGMTFCDFQSKLAFALSDERRIAQQERISNSCNDALDHGADMPSFVKPFLKIDCSTRLDTIACLELDYTFMVQVQAPSVSCEMPLPLDDFGNQFNQWFSVE